ncbi:MAG: STAS domain-containing protein [Treponema sp.]|nr:STAS domain-containing protein [Treponema sp.]
MEQLSITEKNGINYVLFELAGEFTSYTIDGFPHKLYETIQQHAVVIDLAQVTKISDSAIGCIMAAFNDGKAVGHKLYLKSLSIVCDRAFRETGFKELFPVISSVTEVL